MSSVESRRINVKAPVRFDFAGGPTDVEPFRSREKGFVVNGALNLSAEANITPRGDRKIIIHSDDFNQQEDFDSLEEVTLEGSLKLIKAVLKHVSPSTGFEIHTKVDVPPGSGLGSSAALTIALIGGLRTMSENISPESESLVQDALYVENVLLNNIAGGQDQYASVLGGFHSFSFEPDRVVVNTLDLKDETVGELEDRSVLCYGGESHISGNVLNQIMSNYMNGETKTVNALRRMKEVAYQISQVLSNGDLSNFGELIQAVYEIQKNLHSEVVPPNIESISKLARETGALGGRIVGAGGGGCVYFFCEKERNIDLTKALEEKGIKILPLKFTKTGIKITAV